MLYVVEIFIRIFEEDVVCSGEYLLGSLKRLLYVVENIY